MAHGTPSRAGLKPGVLSGLGVLPACRYKQNEAEAARIAEEIVGDKSGNVHQAEERGQSPVGGDVDMTEEDRHAYAPLLRV